MMIETPTIVDSTPQITAVIRITVPRDRIREVMQPAMSEVMAVVTAQGIAPTGPMFSHHFRMSPDVFDFEVGVPVPEPILPSGRVVAGELPSRKVARAVYRGSYEGLGTAWGEFDAWIRENGYATADDLWECYFDGPATELNRPIVAS